MQYVLLMILIIFICILYNYTLNKINNRIKEHFIFALKIELVTGVPDYCIILPFDGAFIQLFIEEDIDRTLSCINNQDKSGCKDKDTLSVYSTERQGANTKTANYNFQSSISAIKWIYLFCYYINPKTIKTFQGNFGTSNTITGTISLLNGEKTISHKIQTDNNSIKSKIINSHKNTYSSTDAIYGSGAKINKGLYDKLINPLKPISSQLLLIKIDLTDPKYHHYSYTDYTFEFSEK